MRLDNNQQAFLALVKAGLWEQEVRLLSLDKVDYGKVMHLSEEQSVIGLVAAGLEHVIDVKVPKEDILQFVGQTLQLELQNHKMNSFIEELIGVLRKADIYTLLVKGQGIAQCYERPFWRACGDVDFLLSRDNYRRAKDFLMPLSSSMEQENEKALHLGMYIKKWMVELHGTLRSCCLPRMDRIIDEVQNDVFYSGNVRSWMNGNTLVFLPSPDNDVFFVFTHIIKHFFCGGIGLRQICDWCRLIWTYKDKLNVKLLENRLRSAGLISEWLAFASLAVEYLGMPGEIMPLYSLEKKWQRKAHKVLAFIFRVGNFGHNRDMSYFTRMGFLKRKLTSFMRHTSDGIHHFSIFPVNTSIYWIVMLKNGVMAVCKGK